jgi:hypothetical protein
MKVYTGLNWQARAIVQLYFPIKHKEFLGQPNVVFFEGNIFTLKLIVVHVSWSLALKKKA